MYTGTAEDLVAAGAGAAAGGSACAAANSPPISVELLAGTLPGEMKKGESCAMNTPGSKPCCICPLKLLDLIVALDWLAASAGVRPSWYTTVTAAPSPGPSPSNGCRHESSR
jgi:hypothetical protein